MGLKIMWDNKTCKTSKTAWCVFTYNYAKRMQNYKPKNALDKTHWMILHAKNALDRACWGMFCISCSYRNI